MIVDVYIQALFTRACHVKLTYCNARLYRAFVPWQLNFTDTSHETLLKLTTPAGQLEKVGLGFQGRLASCGGEKASNTTSLALKP